MLDTLNEVSVLWPPRFGILVSEGYDLVFELLQGLGGREEDNVSGAGVTGGPLDCQQSKAASVELVGVDGLAWPTFEVDVGTGPVVGGTKALDLGDNLGGVGAPVADVARSSSARRVYGPEAFRRRGHRHDEMRKIARRHP